MRAGAGNPLARDLDEVLSFAGDDLRQLRNSRLFVTGGTGFIGPWLLESFLWANRVLELDAQMVVLSRDHDAFAARASHLVSDPALSFLRGDIVDFEMPEGRFTHVIHAAAESSSRQNELDPLRMIDTVATGTRRVLDAARCWGVEKMLFVSTGAVYGTQPGDVERVPEDAAGGPNPMSPYSAYAEAKRLGELLCAAYANQFATPVTVARLFALVGPYQPLDAHFAIANFIRDGLAGGPIWVNGDGTPVRSYLYAADLASWLWSILIRGEAGRAYNVGSEDAHRIAQVAQEVGRAFDPPREVVVTGGSGGNAVSAGEWYVPSTELARCELGVRETVGLAEAIRRTIAWHRVGRS